MNFLDESFWLAVSFIIFVYLIYRPTKKVILKALDSKILEIQEKVLKAEKLKNDANILFAQTEKQIKKLESLRLQMTQEGHEITDKIVQEKNKEIGEFLERKKAETINLIEDQKTIANKELQIEFCSKVIELVSSYFESAKDSQLSETDIVRNLMTKSDKKLDN